jgi:hypothetical protein
VHHAQTTGPGCSETIMRFKNSINARRRSLEEQFDQKLASALRSLRSGN